MGSPSSAPILKTRVPTQTPSLTPTTRTPSFVPSHTAVKPLSEEKQNAAEKTGASGTACVANKDCKSGEECYMGGTKHAACVMKGAFGMGSPSSAPILKTRVPTQTPSLTPTTRTPSFVPSQVPSGTPSMTPSITPSDVPTEAPTLHPSSITPSIAPTDGPSAAPTLGPSVHPSAVPTVLLSSAPNMARGIERNLTKGPTEAELEKPPASCKTDADCATGAECYLAGTLRASCVKRSDIRTPVPLSRDANITASSEPTAVPTAKPTSLPSAAPTMHPSALATQLPSHNPSSAAVSMRIVKLVMAGSVASYTPSVLLKVRSDIAADSGCAANDVSLKVAAGSVVITATMPSASASVLTSKINSGDINFLGGNAVSSAALATLTPTESLTQAPTPTLTKPHISPSTTPTVAPSAMSSAPTNACSTIVIESECFKAGCTFCCDTAENSTVTGCFATEPAAKTAGCVVPGHGAGNMCSTVEFKAKHDSTSSPWMAIAIAGTCGVAVAVAAAVLVTYVWPSLRARTASGEKDGKLPDSEDTDDKQALYMKFPPRSKKGPYNAV